MEDHHTWVGDETGDHDIMDANATPLRAQILRMVRESPPPNRHMPDHFEIRPATLSQKLGISINDASSELCGLLRAVGKGSSFTFEKVGTAGTVQSMVFVFPPDFERRALGAQRRDDLMMSLRQCWNVAVKALKLATAFGLILSTMIVAVAALAALVAALVATSRGGGDARTRNTLTRQMRHLFLTVRQLLWCYAVFGAPGSEEQDPFFREAAYDTWLVLSLCCGNPGSLFFWMRAGHLRRRRHRIARGWGSNAANNVFDSEDTTTSDLEGVSLIRRNAHGQEERLPVPTALEDNNNMENRGLLTSLVEFLFGPNQPMRPSEADKWRLRSAVIMEKSSGTGRNGNSAVSLAELSPYADSPPESIDDEFKVLTEGLVVVSYFNGVPSSQTRTADEGGTDTTSKSKDAAFLFDFPELMAESHMNIRYDDLVDASHESQKDSWKNFFFMSDETGTQTTTLSSRSETPSFLFERRKVFSSLSKQKFVHCLLVASLNLLGVLWFAQSLAPGGLLQESLGGFGHTLRSTLIPILWFYGRLFFAIPTVRLGYILAWNRSCRSRNNQREKLAGELRHSQTKGDVAGHEKETSV